MPSSPLHHFKLETPQTVALNLVAGHSVKVAAGRIWLTLEGHSRDVWLTAPDCWTVPVDAKAWISADGLAEFAVVHPQVLPVVTRSASTTRLWPTPTPA